MPKTSPPRSIATKAATLASRRATATSVAREKTYGHAERMSSTGAAGRSVDLGRAAGFVLTGASVLWCPHGPGPAQRALRRAQPQRAGPGLRLRRARARGSLSELRRGAGPPRARPRLPGRRAHAAYADGNEVVGVDADREAL